MSALGGYDNWSQERSEVLRLYLLGKCSKHIAGITRVPLIRIEHELEKMIERNPDLLRRHMAACYPKRCKRYQGAVIVLDPREQFKEAK